MRGYQVALLKLNRDQDVSGGHNSKHHVRHGHCWSRPESQEPARIERMADIVVEQRRFEPKRCVLAPAQVEINLAHAEKVEVVDQKGGNQDDEEPSRHEPVERDAGVSRSALAGRFTGLIGESPMHYLTNWRIHLAKQLLCEGQHSMAEVAERVGYESEYAFNRAFKRQVGKPPAAWRKKGSALQTPQ